jgi:hypothetical protein
MRADLVNCRSSRYVRILRTGKGATTTHHSLGINLCRSAFLIR